MTNSEYIKLASKPDSEKTRGELIAQRDHERRQDETRSQHWKILVYVLAALLVMAAFGTGLFRR